MHLAEDMKAVADKYRSSLDRKIVEKVGNSIASAAMAGKYETAVMWQEIPDFYREKLVQLITEHGFKVELVDGLVPSERCKISWS